MAYVVSKSWTPQWLSSYRLSARHTAWSDSFTLTPSPGLCIALQPSPRDTGIYLGPTPSLAVAFAVLNGGTPSMQHKGKGCERSSRGYWMEETGLSPRTASSHLTSSASSPHHRPCAPWCLTWLKGLPGDSLCWEGGSSGLHKRPVEAKTELVGFVEREGPHRVSIATSGAAFSILWFLAARSLLSCAQH